MKKIKFLFIATILMLGLTTISCSNSNKKTTESTQMNEHEKIQYTCSMHPEVVKDEPGKCPKCGMELIEKKDHEHEGHNHEHNH